VGAGAEKLILERRALLGVEKSNQTEPSNARRSLCAANQTTAKTGFSTLIRCAEF
jgi:hypothetical protein